MYVGSGPQVTVIRRRRGLSGRKFKNLRGMGAMVCTVNSAGARVCYEAGSAAAVAAGAAAIPGVTGGSGSSLVTPISAPSYPDGTLITLPTGEVDVILGGQRYWIHGLPTLNQLGYSAGNEIPVTQAIANALPVAGGVQLIGSNLVWTDANGNQTSVQPIAPAVSSTAAVPASGLPAGEYYDQYGNLYNAQGQLIQAAASTVTQAPATPSAGDYYDASGNLYNSAGQLIAAAPASSVTSTISSLPSWVWYVGGGVVLLMFLKRR